MSVHTPARAVIAPGLEPNAALRSEQALIVGRGQAATANTPEPVGAKETSWAPESAEMPGSANSEGVKLLLVPGSHWHCGACSPGHKLRQLGVGAPGPHWAQAGVRAEATSLRAP